MLTDRLTIKRSYRWCGESIHIHFKVSREWYTKSEIEQIYVFGSKTLFTFKSTFNWMHLIWINSCREKKITKKKKVWQWDRSSFLHFTSNLSISQLFHFASIWFSYSLLHRIPSLHFPHTLMSFTCLHHYSASNMTVHFIASARSFNVKVLVEIVFPNSLPRFNCFAFENYQNALHLIRSSLILYFCHTKVCSTIQQIPGFPKI